MMQNSENVKRPMCLSNGFECSDTFQRPHERKALGLTYFLGSKAIVLVREYNIKSTRKWPFFALSALLPAINDIFHRQELHTIVQIYNKTKHSSLSLFLFLFRSYRQSALYWVKSFLSGYQMASLSKVGQHTLICIYLEASYQIAFHYGHRIRSGGSSHTPPLQEPNKPS